MTTESEFLRFTSATLEQLCGRIETCVAKLTPEQVWTRGGDQQNAIGNLLLHLAGNVRQWILSGVGGAPDVLTRDAEFAAREGMSPAEMTARLRETVTEAIEVIRGLPAERLLDPITVQGYNVTRMEAIFHVVEHFSGHTFQIIFATKLLTNQDLGFYAHLSGSKKAAAQKPE